MIVEGRGETPASGRIDVLDAQATGRVVFANKTNSPVVVPKGTIVRTGSGTVVRFATTSDVQLPGSLYASAPVGIVALEPGPVGNVQALTINVVEGEVAMRVDVLNDAPTSGGTVKGVPVVDPDFIGCEARWWLAAAAGLRAVRCGVGPRRVRATRVGRGSGDVAVASNQLAGQRSEFLSMTMKVVVRGVAVDGNSLYERHCPAPEPGRGGA